MAETAMTAAIDGAAVAAALRRTAQAVGAQRDHLTTLDQALGDGDMGINLGKIADALLAYAAATPIDDIGRYLSQAGATANRAGPSTMGTLVATALMRAGKAIPGKTTLTDADLATMLAAADVGIQERGKAQPGDKTIVDALHPAAEAFAAAVAAGAGRKAAGAAALEAAKSGRDRVTPLRSRVGRAGWVGERTEGKIDPGCELFVLVLSALIEG